MKIMIMTGGTSGIGLVAAKKILEAGNIRLIMGIHATRTLVAETIDLDLACLDSVRLFAALTLERIGDEKIDALVFNAGIQFPSDDNLSKDGIEKTFAVNHLSHYLLLRLLIPHLQNDATIILTTSGTHDPAGKTLMAPPRHAKAEFLAYPHRDPDHDRSRITAGERAYSASKLCVLLTARALAEYSGLHSLDLNVIAYDPGLTPGTGLAKSWPQYVQVIWKLFSHPLIARYMPKINSQTGAGITLAMLADRKICPPKGRIYGALRKEELTWPDPSDLAQRDDVMKALWDDSDLITKMDLPV